MVNISPRIDGEEKILLYLTIQESQKEKQRLLQRRKSSLADSSRRQKGFRLDARRKGGLPGVPDRMDELDGGG